MISFDHTKIITNIYVAFNNNTSYVWYSKFERNLILKYVRLRILPSRVRGRIETETRIRNTISFDRTKNIYVAFNNNTTSYEFNFQIYLQLPIFIEKYLRRLCSKILKIRKTDSNFQIRIIKYSIFSHAWPNRNWNKDSKYN